jgi:hypothetical protein
MINRIFDLKSAVRLSNVFKTMFLSTLFTLFFVSCSTETPTKKAVAVDSVDGILMPESAAAMSDGRIIISEIGEFGKDGDGKIVQITVDGEKKSDR